VTISEEGLRIGSRGKGTGGPEQEQHSGGQTLGRGTQEFGRRARADRTGQGNSRWRWEWELGQATQKDGFLADFRGRRDFLLKRGQASKVNS
jgi:hypothetical protein